jgi:hypothetical protein
MTCVSTAAFFESNNFWELVNEMLDLLPKDYLTEVYARYLGETYISGSSGFDHSTIRSLNETPFLKKHNPDTKFDENTIELYKNTLSKFYGS